MIAAETLASPSRGECPYCGGHSPRTAIIMHLGRTEDRLDRGQNDARADLTPIRWQEVLGLTQGSCYTAKRILMRDGMIERGERMLVAFRRSGYAYHLTEAGRRRYEAMRRCLR